MELLKTNNRIPSYEVNADILFAKTTPAYLADDLSRHFKKRRWRKGNSLNIQKNQYPIRVIKYQGVDWSVAYPVDKTKGKLSKFFSVHGMLDYSLGVTWTVIHLCLSSTSGCYGLREYRMGYAINEWIYSGNQNLGLLHSDIFDESCLIDLYGLNNKMVEFDLFYGNIDGGARDTNGAILKFEDVEPLHDLVQEHYLLI